MFEYAISEGEGTLIDYGVAIDEDLIEIIEDALATESVTMIFAPCHDDCETGR